MRKFPLQGFTRWIRRRVMGKCRRITRKLHGFFLVFMLAAGCSAPVDKNVLHAERASRGEVLFGNYGCKACHSLTGDNMYGPSLNNILHKKVEVSREKKTDLVVVDRAYLMRSLMDPGYEKVAGYQDRTMPKPDIPEHDMESIVEYLIQVNMAFQPE